MTLLMMIKLVLQTVVKGDTETATGVEKRFLQLDLKTGKGQQSALLHLLLGVPL